MSTRSLDYLDGLGAALGGLAVLALGAFGVRAGDLAAMYGQFGGRIPVLTEVVLHPAWRWGAPVLTLAVLVLAHLRGRHRLAVLAAGLVAAALAVATYAAAQYPVWALAGRIADS